MLFLSVPGSESFNQGRQLTGRLKPSPLPILNNRSRKSPSLWLIPVLPKNPSQFGLTPTIHQSGSSEGLPQIHPHIERTIVLKTESARGVIELR